MLPKGEDWSERSTSALDVIRDRRAADPVLAAELDEIGRKLRLGIAIQELRERRKLTQMQLAQLTGTSQSAIARIESADYERMSLSTLQKIARALNADLSITFRPHRWRKSPPTTATAG
ncbi:MAG: helix-turn-helix transcriptional regulator [Calditrichaeota bacterium]|nr:helix-turn-helix transcriptional regulator [Calditrichota bacterium]